MILWSAAIGGGIAAVGAVVWGLHRLCVVLEDRGYIYYRKGSGGGSATAGAFMEMDRLTRPSVEHVIQVKTSQVKEEQDRAGDDE